MLMKQPISIAPNEKRKFAVAIVDVRADSLSDGRRKRTGWRVVGSEDAESLKAFERGAQQRPCVQPDVLRDVMGRHYRIERARQHAPG